MVETEDHRWIVAARADRWTDVDHQWIDAAVAWAEWVECPRWTDAVDLMAIEVVLFVL